MAVILVLMECHSSARATPTVIDLMVVRQSANIFLIKVTTLPCILYELELFLNNNCIPIGNKLFFTICLNITMSVYKQSDQQTSIYHTYKIIDISVHIFNITRSSNYFFFRLKMIEFNLVL